MSPHGHIHMPAHAQVKHMVNRAVLEGLRVEGGSDEAERIQNLFKHFDVDNDGSVSWRERG